MFGPGVVLGCAWILGTLHAHGAAGPATEGRRGSSDPIEASSFQDASKSIDDLLERVLASGSSASKRDIARIGERANEDAFRALREIVAEIPVKSVLDAAFEALAGFRETELEEQVIAFVAGAVFDRDETRRHAAAWGLLRYEERAAAEFVRVVDESKDPVCRAIALQGLLPRIRREPTPEALQTLLENTILGVTVWRPELLAMLAAFRGEAALAVFDRGLKDRGVSPFVKTVVVDTLGGRPEAEASAATGTGVLRTALRVRHPSVEYAALRWLRDPSGPDPALYRSEVARLVRSDDPSVRRAAGIVQGRIRRQEEPEEDHLKGLRKLARSRHAPDRQAAAFLAAELGTEEAAQIVHELLEDRDRTVAAEALVAAGEMRRRESIPLLIRLLEQATGRPRVDIPEVLRSLTGLDHGLTAGRWRAWWDDAGTEFVVPSLEEVLGRQAELAQIRDAYETRAEFYGLPVVSDRLAFVVDASGSMRYRAAKRTTRLEVALRELLSVLDRLPDGTLINVVFFATHVEPWKEKLVELDDGSRSSLETFIRYRRPGGFTNIYDALESATLDRRIDTVYLLTDGQPEGGATTDPDQIRLEVERWNSTGHIVIHGVSIGGDNQLVRDLASATGGRFLIPE